MNLTPVFEIGILNLWICIALIFLSRKLGLPNMLRAA